MGLLKWLLVLWLNGDGKNCNSLCDIYNLKLWKCKKTVGKFNTCHHISSYAEHSTSVVCISSGAFSFVLYKNQNGSKLVRLMWLAKNEPVQTWEKQTSGTILHRTAFLIPFLPAPPKFLTITAHPYRVITTHPQCVCTPGYTRKQSHHSSPLSNRDALIFSHLTGPTCYFAV